VKYKIANFFIYEAVWLACVLGAAKGYPLLGLFFVSLAIGLHLKVSARPRIEARLVLVAVGMGLVFDSLLVSGGWLSYANGMIAPGIAPYWILAMWAGFATTMNASMSWIKINLLVATMLGATFGPLSYLAGQEMGAVTFTSSTSIIAVGIAWTLAMPLLVIAARRLDGFKPLTIATAIEPTPEVVPG
jgi:hypothetical protein